MRYGSARTKAYTRISLDAEHLSLKANIIITNEKEEDALWVMREGVVVVMREDAAVARALSVAQLRWKRNTKWI
jgi:hypothetical protein